MPSFKEFFLESPETGNRVPPPRPGFPGRRKQPGKNPKNVQAETFDYKTYLLLGVLCAMTVAIFTSAIKRSEIPLDPVTLCPVDERHISGRTYVLMDLSEKLRTNQRESLRALLQISSTSLQSREKILISKLQSNRQNPRQEVLSFCSPDISYIEDIAGRRVVPEKHCEPIINGEFPWAPGIREESREKIGKTCMEYVDLQARTIQAVQSVPDNNPEESRSYIVRAVEDIMHDANAAPGSGRLRLIVFSDMLQNSEWFSQYTGSHGAWSIENLRERRRQANGMGAEPDNKFNEVLLCYLKNGVITTSPSKNAHRKMWKNYFAKPKSVFRDATASGCGNMAKFMMGEAGET